MDRDSWVQAVEGLAQLLEHTQLPTSPHLSLSAGDDAVQQIEEQLRSLTGAHEFEVSSFLCTSLFAMQLTYLHLFPCRICL